MTTHHPDYAARRTRGIQRDVERRQTARGETVTYREYPVPNFELDRPEHHITPARAAPAQPHIPVSGNVSRRRHRWLRLSGVLICAVLVLSWILPKLAAFANVA